jgi:hypothetical protein
MSELNVTTEAPKAGEKTTAQMAAPAQKPVWETPKLEDVSEQVMAQPYIRFT